MKIRAFVRKICEKCRLIRRRGRIIVIYEALTPKEALYEASHNLID